MILCGEGYGLSNSDVSPSIACSTPHNSVTEEYSSFTIQGCSECISENITLIEIIQVNAKTVKL